MKTYTKIHSNNKAVQNHVKRIEARGGIATTIPIKGGTQVEYYFPDTKAKKSPIKKEKKKKYDILSPDGFSIRIGDVKPFSSPEEGDAYFVKWKNRYVAQGYYSSTQYGRIDLKDLKNYCESVEYDPNRLV